MTGGTHRWPIHGVEKRVCEQIAQLSQTMSRGFLRFTEFRHEQEWIDIRLADMRGEHP